MIYFEMGFSFFHNGMQIPCRQSLHFSLLVFKCSTCSQLLVHRSYWHWLKKKKKHTLWEDAGNQEFGRTRKRRKSRMMERRKRRKERSMGRNGEIFLLYYKVATPHVSSVFPTQTCLRLCPYFPLPDLPTSVALCVFLLKSALGVSPLTMCCHLSSYDFFKT